MSFMPIELSGSEGGAESWQAIKAIAEDLESGNDDEPISRRIWHDRSIFLGHLGVVTKDKKLMRQATRALNQAIARADQLSGYCGLFGGLCGLGWAVQRVSRLWIEFELLCAADRGVAEESEFDLRSADKCLRQIDNHVLARLQSHDTIRQYDLIGGLVGIGMYFLERDPSKVRTDALQTIVGRIESTAVNLEVGCSWMSDPAVLQYWEGVVTSGYYNLGVAHGVPGILFFLSEAARAGILKDKCYRLLERGMEWFLSTNCQGEPSHFKRWIAASTHSDARPLAWCYGDLGITVVLSQIAQRANRAEWLQTAYKLVDDTVACAADQIKTRDPSVCHGAIGVSYIFHRLHQIWGRYDCYDVSNQWLRHTLTLRKPGTGIGGFLSFSREGPAKPLIQIPSSALLDGASGIGLALLGMLVQGQTDWDRMLLLSGLPN